MTGDPGNIAALSVGAMVGGVRPESRKWGDVVMALAREVESARQGIESPLRVNVVFQVPGEVVPVTFSGVRTGRYAESDRHLLVQVALPPELPSDPEAMLRELLDDAIDAAADFARKRGIADDLPELRQIVEAVEPGLA